MKTKSYYLMIILTTILIWNCQNEPIMPDPGFDVVSDKNISVRRDTSDSYTLLLNVNAPAGVNVIQILNGRDYTLIEEFEEYKGKKEFPFEYKVDFKEFNPNVDTTLIYNIQVYSLDNKSYNVSFSIKVIKLSFPELKMKSGNKIATNLPFFSLSCDISGGIYSLKSIKAYIDDYELLNVSSDILQDTTDYSFTDVILSYDVEEGKTYIIKFFIEDERGMIGEAHVELVGLILKRPKHLVLIRSDGNLYRGTYDIEYDDENRMTLFRYTSPDIPNDSYTMEFLYNHAGNVYRVEYFNHHVNRNRLNYVNFTYDSNERLTRVKHECHYFDDDDIFHWDEIKNFVYREDGTVYSFDAGITTFTDIIYTDGFGVNEKLFSEKWSDFIEDMTLSEREFRTGYVPILNPLYVKGLPPFWYTSTNATDVNNLLFYKYVYTVDFGGPGHRRENDVTKYYRYTVNSEGYLESFGDLRTSGWLDHYFIY